MAKDISRNCTVWRVADLAILYYLKLDSHFDLRHRNMLMGALFLPWEEEIGYLNITMFQMYISSTAQIHRPCKNLFLNKSSSVDKRSSLKQK